MHRTEPIGFDRPEILCVSTAAAYRAAGFDRRPKQYPGGTEPTQPPEYSRPHIIMYPPPGRRARRLGIFYGSGRERMEDGGGKGMSCKTAIFGISYDFTLSSKIVM